MPNSPDLITKRIIFELRFQPKFEIIDMQGHILANLQESKLFEELLTVGKNEILARDNKNDIMKSLSLSVQRLGCSIEGTNLKIDDYHDYYKLANSVLERCQVSKILRIGVRVISINKNENFADSNRKIISLLDDEVIKSLSNSGESFIDSAIVPVMALDGGNKIRIAFGPLQKSEWISYFEREKTLDCESSFCFDCDFYSISYGDYYKSIRVDKYVETAKNVISTKITGLNKILTKD